MVIMKIDIMVIMKLLKYFNRNLYDFISALLIEEQKKLEIRKSVVGLAQLNNIIYVLHEWCDTLSVFDCVSFERLDDVKLMRQTGKSIHVDSIAACSINQCLYLADVINKCILRLEINNGEKTVRWINKYRKVK